jgi:hypothetical protein
LLWIWLGPCWSGWVLEHLFFVLKRSFWFGFKSHFEKLFYQELIKQQNYWEIQQASQFVNLLNLTRLKYPLGQPKQFFTVSYQSQYIFFLLITFDWTYRFRLVPL